MANWYAARNWLEVGSWLKGQYGESLSRVENGINQWVIFQPPSVQKSKTV
jgi:hypothetical protein